MRRFAALFIPVVIFAAACSSNEPVAYAGYQRSPLPDVGEHVLPDADGGEFSLAASSDNVLLVYFGYTSCPDVCPTTLADMKQVMQLLGKKADKVQFIMISVDPERDTPERMQAFVTHFDPRFLGLTGSAEDIARIAAAYGIYYQKHEGTAASGYLVDHTASLLVLDPQGYLRLLLPPTLTPAEVAEDLNHLVR